MIEAVEARRTFISLLAISTVAQVANIAEIVVLGIKEKTLHLWLLLSLSLADLLSSLLWSTIVIIYFLNIPHGKGTDVYTIFAVAIGFAMVSSWLHVGTIAFDKYTSVFHPLKHMIMVNTRKMKVTVLLSIWSLSIIVTGVLYGIGLTAFRSIDALLGIASILMDIFLATVYVSIILKVIQLAKLRKDMDADFQSGGQHNSPINYQEKATIVNCSLTALSFVICTCPMVINLFQGELIIASLILLVLMPCLNPFTYIFSNYIRRCCFDTTEHQHNTEQSLALSGPAFSVGRQARRGAQRPGCQKSRLTSTD